MLVFIVVLILLSIGTFVASRLLKTETTIGPAPAAVVTHVSDKRKAPQLFTEPLYSFELPSDWEKYTPISPVANSLSWHNTAGEKGVRMLTIYTDAAVQAIAVNRALSVSANAASLSVNGEISDNCTKFTSPTSHSAGTASAKWQGVDFLCDTGNYVRNVIGIGAAGTLNSVILTGPTSGKHSVFMTYTDNGSSPDVSIFTTMLQTFKLK